MFLLIIPLVSTLLVECARCGDAPPPAQLKTYPLHNNPHSADISPGEKFVVTEITTNELIESGTRRITEIVQLWNFKEDRLVAALPLTQFDTKASVTASELEPVHIARIVRFSPDGNVVVVIFDQTVYVLRGSDLAEIRRIYPVRPAPVTQDYAGLAVTIKSFVNSFEISPNGETLAIFWASDFTSGRIDLFSLSTGSYIRGWETPEGWSASSNGLHWHPNGRFIIVAIPNAKSCQSSTHQPDIFGFDAETGATRYRLTSGMDSPRVIVTPDSRVLAVPGPCVHNFSHNHSKLKVFDLISAKHLHDGSSRVTGVGYSISASADGKRFLAFTGEVRKKFDWGDAYFYYVDVDRKFSVWSLTEYAGIVTSQDVPNLEVTELRLSPNGRYAVSCGKASFIFDLPKTSVPD